MSWFLPDFPLEVKHPRSQRKFLVCFWQGIPIECGSCTVPCYWSSQVFSSAIEGEKIEGKSFTEVRFYTDNKDNLEGCALWIISVTFPECWCAFLLHLCSNSHFTEEEGGQQPLLYLEQCFIFSLNEGMCSRICLVTDTVSFPFFLFFFFFYYYSKFIQSLALSSSALCICLMSGTDYRKLSAEAWLQGKAEGWEHWPAPIHLAEALECSYSFFFRTGVLSLLQNMKVKVHLLSCSCLYSLKL